MPHFGDQPQALLKNSSEQMILNWQIDAFNKQFKNIDFVGGYKSGEIKKVCPEISLEMNKNWNSISSIGSFLSNSTDYIK